MSAVVLDAQDREILGLALNLLDRHTGFELQLARKAPNPVKEAAVIGVRGRMLVVRAKLRDEGVAVTAAEARPEPVDKLERQLTTVAVGGDALTLAGKGNLEPEDCELILRALDVFDRLVQDELATKQDATLINTRSRLLILRIKLTVMMRVSP